MFEEHGVQTSEIVGDAEVRGIVVGEKGFFVAHNSKAQQLGAEADYDGRVGVVLRRESMGDVNGF